MNAKDKESAKVFLSVEGQKYLVATLQAGRTDQVHVEFNVFPGQSASLHVQGQGEVHAIGFLGPLDEGNMQFFLFVSSIDCDESVSIYFFFLGFPC